MDAKIYEQYNLFLSPVRLSGMFFSFAFPLGYSGLVYKYIDLIFHKAFLTSLCVSIVLMIIESYFLKKKILTSTTYSYINQNNSLCADLCFHSFTKDNILLVFVIKFND